MASLPAFAVVFSLAGWISRLVAVCEDDLSFLVGGRYVAFSLLTKGIVVHTLALAARVRGLVVAGFWGHRGV